MKLNQETRTIIAIVLCGLIFLGYYVFQMRKARDARPGMLPPTAEEVPAAEKNLTRTSPAVEPTRLPIGMGTTAQRRRPRVLHSTRRSVSANPVLETEHNRIELDENGGAIRGMSARYLCEENGCREQAVLIATNGILPLRTWLGVPADGMEGGEDEPWALVETTRDRVTFVQSVESAGARCRIRKSYETEENGFVRLTVVLSNVSAVSFHPGSGNGLVVAMGPYAYPQGRPARGLMGSRPSEFFSSYYTPGGKLEDVLKKGVGETGRAQVAATTNTPDRRSFVWASLENMHFIAALLPDEGNGPRETLHFARASVTVPEGGTVEDSRHIFLVEELPTIPPRTALRYSYRLYVSAKIRKHLVLAGEGLAASKRNTKILKPFIVAIENGINLIYRGVGNYGVAIILVTILVKLLLLYPNLKSTQSQQRMQKLQPRIQELRARYKSDAQKMNEEMMALYRREKVNPMGGCLPLLLQMPVFIAMFATLRYMPELKGSPFIGGWINDLTAPDVVPLPFVLPVIGRELHILPLLMTSISYVQQAMTPTPQTGNQQTKMLKYMPLFFLLILYNMNSGLVLYWTTQSLLQVGLLYGTKLYRKRKEEAAQAG